MQSGAQSVDRRDAACRDLYLIYHEIYADPDQYRYSISVKEFGEHLRVITELNSDLQPGSRQVRLTFDDGHSTHFEQAFPVLEKHRMKGVFFVTVGWIGNRADFMSWSQVQEIANTGHEIQAHGLSHRFLTSCDDDELRTELQIAKTELEQRLGRPVNAISMPGGRWDRRVVKECGRVGFSRVFTSDPFLMQTLPNVQLIGRINVGAGFGINNLKRLPNRSSFISLSYTARHLLKTGVRRAFGDRLYHLLWRWWADEGSKGIHSQP